MLPITAIATFNDNYVWVIRQAQGNHVWLVDPGDATPVIARLEAEHWQLQGILVTHSHADHIGGLNALLDYCPVPVLGPACSEIPQISEPLGDGDKRSLFGAQLEALATPGHLPEHLCYVLRDGNDCQLFSGDVLFSSGCGRVFRGSTEELKTSLDRLKRLPPQTQIYCAHEYTLANLAFAKHVEGDNPALHTREQAVRNLRQQGQPSLPSTLALELEVNPFLRCQQPAISSAIGQYLDREPVDERDVFVALRRWKDHFKP